MALMNQNRPRVQRPSLQALGSPSTNVGSPLQADGPSPYPSFQPNAAGSYNLKGQGLPRGMKGINRQVAQTNLGLMQASVNPLMATMNDLIKQANTDRFSDTERSAYLAPRLQVLDGQYNQAGGMLDRTLASRGMDTSSGAVQNWANLSGQNANARAGLISGLFDAEEGRQQQAQAQLRDMLMLLQGRSGQQASNNAQFGMNYQLQKQAMDQQNNPFMDAIMGMVGLGGAYLGRPRYPSLGSAGGVGSGVGGAVGGYY
jgi:hypothetical protein